MLLCYHVAIALNWAANDQSEMAASMSWPSLVSLSYTGDVILLPFMSVV